MMYTVKFGDEILSNPILAQQTGQIVIDGEVSDAVNAISTFEFKITPHNPKYDDVKPFSSLVAVYDGDERIFLGRIISTELDFYNVKSVTCESELAYLCDAVCRPYAFTGTIKSYMNLLLGGYNADCSSARHIYVGNVTVTDSNDNIVRASESAVSLWDELHEKLVDNLGGYLVLRYGSDGTRYLDYLADFTATSDQKIEFAVNLLDITQYLDASSVKTACIPYGARLEETDTNYVKTPSGFYNGNRLTLTSSTYDYVYNETGTNLFGWIYCENVWDDITIESNLRTAAQKYIDNQIEEALTIEIKAVDLSLIKVSAGKINVGQYVNVVSRPHNLDAKMLCSEKTTVLDDPSQTSLTIGKTKKTLTGLLS